MVQAAAGEGEARVARLHFNLLLIGDGGVGKTSVMKRYVNKKFDAAKIATSGVDFCSVKYKSDTGEDCRVKIWDTAGQERFRQLTNSFFKDADGVIVTFDLTQQDTFLNSRDWINSVFKYKDKGIPMVLVGNKIDLADQEGQRAVDMSQGTDLATQYDMKYVETSAKADIGVSDLMDHIFKITYAYKKANAPPPDVQPAFTL